MKYFILFLLLFSFSCQRQGQEEELHSHDSHNGDHHHQTDLKQKRTVWTDKSELFVEFEALILSKSSDFAVHLTQLQGHKAVVDSELSLLLVRDTLEQKLHVEAPSSMGIFTFSLEPKTEGLHQLIFEVEGQDFKDRIELGKIRVYKNLHDAQHHLSHKTEAPPSISFGKEQAWNTNFQTFDLQLKNTFPSLAATGIAQALPTNRSSLIAPVSGRLVYNLKDLVLGREVHLNQHLLSIEDVNLSGDNWRLALGKAKAEYQQLSSEYQRKQELLKSKIISKAEFEKLEAKYLKAKLNYENLAKESSAKGKRLLADRAGFLNSILVPAGAYVEAGAPLLEIVNTDTWLLEISISQKYYADMDSLMDIQYKDAEGQWHSVVGEGGQLFSVSKSVNPDQPNLVLSAMVNRPLRAPIGSICEAELLFGTDGKKLMVPKSALLEDYGQYSIIVQLSGEDFEKRNVELGAENGSEVEVLNGLKPGDRIVSEGAYQVKMAALSGQAPAHGHSH
ncbi:MAG: efflux RND transporter periplasmic adaptor subunit [Bacteroidetes bacterium]|nr:efflux RND transporter periplasmic adaptor subunit [Bacteroidota bacterium]